MNDNLSFKGAKITNYTKKRYFGYGIIAIIAFILPFIKVNGNHFFLLSFDRKELHLFFQAFSTQELFLMPFLLILLFLGIFFVTTLGGRVWCGWACPQTIFRVVYRDFIETKLLGIRRTIKNKQKIQDGNFTKKLIAKILFAIIALMAASNLLWYFIPPEDFFRYIADPLNHKLTVGIVLGFAIFLFIDVVYIQENFCIYICPYARVQSVMFDENTIQVIYDEGRGGKIYDENHAKISDRPKSENDECIGCMACVKICPTHIDIRRGMQLECINCLECADVCSVTMSKFDKKSLINWTSDFATQNRVKTQILRFRTIGYMVALSVALVALLLMGASRESMLLNINRDSSLYNIRSVGSDIVIENDYIFLMENTDRVSHEFFFDVSDERIEIKRPKGAVKIEAGKKDKVIVTLTTKAEDLNQASDINIPLKIKAYATDAKDRIFVERDTMFIYPKGSEIERRTR